MAHEFESGFFTGKGAWHRLGNVLTAAPTIEEGILQAGLDWEVEEHAIFAQNTSAMVDGRPTMQACDEHKALIRSTDRSVLGIVGAKYQVLQNRDAFQWFAPFLEDGAATLEAAGSLRKGRRVWVLAKIAIDPIDIRPGDAVTAYLLLTAAHDGTAAVGAGFTPIRVVCANTLSAALAEGGKRAKKPPAIIKLRHTSGLPQALTAVQESIDLARRTFAFTAEQYRAMAAAALNTEGLKGYIRRVLNPVDAVLDAALAAANEPTEEQKDPRATDQIVEYFETDPLAGATVWGGYNAITHWLDHTRGADDEKRLDQTWFGVGKNIRTRAHAEAMALTAGKVGA